MIAKAMTGRFSPSAVIGSTLINGAIAATVAFAGAPILFVALLAVSSLGILIGFSTDAGLPVSPFLSSIGRDSLLRYLHSIPTRHPTPPTQPSPPQHRRRHGQRDREVVIEPEAEQRAQGGQGGSRFGLPTSLGLGSEGRLRTFSHRWGSLGRAEEGR